MTAIVLTGFIGSGTPRDAFRPDLIHDGTGYAIYDLRSDKTVTDGWCVAVVTGETTWSAIGQSFDLTDSLSSPIPGNRRKAVGDVLGITVTPGMRIGEALLAYDDSLGGLIVPDANGKRKLVIGGVVVGEDP